MSSSASTPSSVEAGEIRAGLIAALFCYGVWGMFPLLFKLVAHVDSLTIVAHRVVWALISVAIFLAIRNRLGEVWAVFTNRRVLLALMASALFLAINWLAFIWAVTSGNVLESSFGYFISPLVNVAMGTVLLKEKQNRVQTIAIAIAVFAVLIQGFGLGSMPWAALAMAFAFGFYGYFRKTVVVGAAPGLMVETMIMLPVAAAFIGYVLATTGPGPIGDPLTYFYIIMAGTVTSGVLVLFAFAARRLRLSTIGMFQYIPPSLQFIMAVWLFGEPLGIYKLVSFALIWLSLSIFTWDSWRRQRAVPPVETPPIPRKPA